MCRPSKPVSSCLHSAGLLWISPLSPSHLYSQSDFLSFARGVWKGGGGWDVEGLDEAASLLETSGSLRLEPLHRSTRPSVLVSTQSPLSVSVPFINFVLYSGPSCYSPHTALAVLLLGMLFPEALCPAPSSLQSAHIVTFSREHPLTTEINTATCLLIAVPHLLSFLDFFYLLFS